MPKIVLPNISRTCFLVNPIPLKIRYPPLRINLKYVCPFCGKALGSPQTYENHVDVEHTHEERIQCAIGNCTKRFSCTSRFSIHKTGFHGLPPENRGRHAQQHKAKAAAQAASQAGNDVVQQPAALSWQPMKTLPSPSPPASLAPPSSTHRAPQTFESAQAHAQASFAPHRSPPTVVQPSRDAQPAQASGMQPYASQSALGSPGPSSIPQQHYAHWPAVVPQYPTAQMSTPCAGPATFPAAFYGAPITIPSYQEFAAASTSHVQAPQSSELQMPFNFAAWAPSAPLPYPAASFPDAFIGAPPTTRSYQELPVASTSALQQAMPFDPAACAPPAPLPYPLAHIPAARPNPGPRHTRSASESGQRPAAPRASHRRQISMPHAPYPPTAYTQFNAAANGHHFSPFDYPQALPDQQADWSRVQPSAFDSSTPPLTLSSFQSPATYASLPLTPAHVPSNVHISRAGMSQQTDGNAGYQHYGGASMLLGELSHQEVEKTPELDFDQYVVFAE